MAAQNATQSPVISTRGVEMHFRRTSALQGVTLDIRPGTVFALLGENGAGKTTLIRILTGFQKPSSGDVTVCGINPTVDPTSVRRRIGYVSDAPALYDWMTVSQIGGFTASLYDEQFLPRFENYIKRYEIHPSQKIKHLSKGQRAKVALSLSMSHDPDVLIMDEPTSGLDPKVRKSFLESMIDRAATGQTVLLSSHQISEVERVADEIAIMHHGKIRLHDSLESIRQTVSELLIDVDDPLRALPRLPSTVEVLTEEMEGRQRRLIVRYLDQSTVDEIRLQEGVSDVHRRTATLEEIFVAYTTDAEEPTDQSLGGGDGFDGDGGTGDSPAPPHLSRSRVAGGGSSGHPTDMQRTDMQRTDMQRTDMQRTSDESSINSDVQNLVETDL